MKFTTPVAWRDSENSTMIEEHRKCFLLRLISLKRYTLTVHLNTLRFIAGRLQCDFLSIKLRPKRPVAGLFFVKLYLGWC